MFFFVSSNVQKEEKLKNGKLSPELENEHRWQIKSYKAIQAIEKVRNLSTPATEFCLKVSSCSTQASKNYDTLLIAQITHGSNEIPNADYNWLNITIRLKYDNFWSFLKRRNKTKKSWYNANDRLVINEWISHYRRSRATSKYVTHFWTVPILLYQISCVLFSSIIFGYFNNNRASLFKSFIKIMRRLF